jgi:uncharacterized protein DUF2637
MTMRAGRRNPIRGREALLLVAAAMMVVGIVGQAGSWQHQYELYLRYGQAKWVAALYPLSVEGLIAAAGLVIWFASSRQLKASAWMAWAALCGAVGYTTLVNLASSHRWEWWWLGPVISVWPAVAFLAACEMVAWLARHGQARKAAPDDAGHEARRAAHAAEMEARRANFTREKEAAKARRAGLALVPDAADADEKAREAWLKSVAEGQPLTDRKLAERHGRSRTYWTPRIREWQEAGA